MGVFFFFKQKTAYEMCGRDWSSDVCSSDLTGIQGIAMCICPISSLVVVFLPQFDLYSGMHRFEQSLKLLYCEDEQTRA